MIISALCLIIASWDREWECNKKRAAFLFWQSLSDAEKGNLFGPWFFGINWLSLGIWGEAVSIWNSRCKFLKDKSWDTSETLGGFLLHSELSSWARGDFGDFSGPAFQAKSRAAVHSPMNSFAPGSEYGFQLWKTTLRTAELGLGRYDTTG